MKAGKKMSLTSQDIDLLKYMIRQDGIVSAKAAGEFLSVEERAFRYRISKIQHFLDEEKMSSRIEIVPRKGFYLSDKAALQKWLDGFERKLDLTNYQYTFEESLKFILLKLIIERDFVENSELQVILNLSGPTVKQYLSRVKSDLANSELKLIHAKRRGYKLIGEKEVLEKKLVKVLVTSLSLFEIIHFIKNEGETQTKLGELLLANILDIHTVELAAQKVEKLEREINLPLGDLEFIHWVIHHIFENLNFGAESSFQQEASFKENSHLDPEKFGDELIHRVESVLSVNLRSAGSNFESSLKAHIKSLGQRIQAHRFVENPIYESFVSEYGEFTRFLENIIQEICDEKNVRINNQEISLIAILFLSEIQKNQKQEGRLPAVLVICTEGRIISNIVANRIRSLFEARKLDVCTVHKVSEEIIRQYDIVFSTIPLPKYMEKDAVYINPSFTREDLKTISGYMPWKLNIENNGLNKFSEIVEMIEKNATVKDWAKLEFMLLKALNSRESRTVVKENLQIDFSLDSVKVIDAVVNWEKGIDIACEHLISVGCIESRYREKIKRNTREFGAYMTVSPGVFIAHAGIDDGCLKDGISVTKFAKKGLKIVANQQQPIDFVITVAFKDTKANIILERTVSFIRDKEKMEELRMMSDKNDIYNFFKYHYLNL
ncbi:MAG: PTS sugar transporter subunit IIA [Streptococcaceae bacterium]|jgi:transcriptional antiterminator/mannitol/fructose-specific phosphotransferase system IIA component (Ntr-type)|nr:PTS sugar transporter subunit IIA [Streptococcaceae bacterium]